MNNIDKKHVLLQQNNTLKNMTTFVNIEVGNIFYKGSITRKIKCTQKFDNTTISKIGVYYQMQRNR